MSKSKYKETKEEKLDGEKIFEEIIMPNFPELKQKLNKSYGKCS